MNFVVFDLEWNQSNTGKEPEVKEFPFEIIDIGAIQMNEKREMVSEFNQLVRPTVYQQMHYMTSKIIHLHMEDLKKGRPFPEVMEEFRDWCGEQYIFCTWGSLDIYELQRNMHFYGMKPLSDSIIRFLDVQKLFSIAFEDGKSRRSLEYAIDFLQIEKDIPFHRAFSDAYYTAKVLALIEEPVLSNYSFDNYILPRNKQEEIHVTFDGYYKYISMVYPDKQEALLDKDVISTKCYLCENHRNLRKKVRWFTPNGKHFYSIAVCPVHGYMKSKIRVRRAEGEAVYIVKTCKFISEEDCEKLVQKQEIAKAHRKIRKKNARNGNS